MAFTFVDLLRQVQNWLPVRYGGTGNPRGWATDTVIGAYVNGTGLSITRGTVVELARYTTMSGDVIRDSRIKPTTTAGSQTVVGVVVGRFRTAEPFNQYEDATCADGNVCAVAIMGKALTNVEGTVIVGYFAYTAATDGAASGSENLGAGGFGTWESGGSGQQQLRLWGAPATPGVAGGILVVFGDGVTQIQPGTLVDVPMPAFNIRLVSWELLSTVVGSISIDIYRDTYGNFPPQGTDSITDTTPPTITGGIKAQGTVPYGIDPLFSPTGWDRDIDVGETLRAIVESAAGVTQVSMMLRYVRR